MQLCTRETVLKMQCVVETEHHAMRQVGRHRLGDVLMPQAQCLPPPGDGRCEGLRRMGLGLCLGCRGVAVVSWGLMAWGLHDLSDGVWHRSSPSFGRVSFRRGRWDDLSGIPKGRAGGAKNPAPLTCVEHRHRSYCSLGGQHHGHHTCTVWQQKNPQRIHEASTMKFAGGPLRSRSVQTIQRLRISSQTLDRSP